MQTVIEKVMQTFGLMHTLTDEQPDEAKQAVSDFLANNPQEDEHKAIVEALAFLRGRGA